MIMKFNLYEHQLLWIILLNALYTYMYAHALILTRMLYILTRMLYILTRTP